MITFAFQEIYSVNYAEHGSSRSLRRDINDARDFIQQSKPENNANVQLANGHMSSGAFIQWGGQQQKFHHLAHFNSPCRGRNCLVSCQACLSAAWSHFPITLSDIALQLLPKPEASFISPSFLKPMIQIQQNSNFSPPEDRKQLHRAPKFPSVLLQPAVNASSPQPLAIINPLFTVGFKWNHTVRSFSNGASFT